MIQKPEIICSMAIGGGTSVAIADFCPFIILITCVESIGMLRRFYRASAWLGNSRYQSRADYVKLRAPDSINLSNRESGEEPWLTKKNARTQRAPVRHSRMASTAALHAKARAKRSSWIATAGTTSVRESSELAGIFL